MAISKEHEAFIRQTAWQVAAEVEDRLGKKIDAIKPAVDLIVSLHVAECATVRRNETETLAAGCQRRSLARFSVLIAGVAVIIAAVSLWWRVSSASGSMRPTTRPAVYMKGTP